MPKANNNQTLKSSHGGYSGKSIIEKLEIDMDKRRKVMGGLIISKGAEIMTTFEYAIEKGRYEGLAQALARMRSSKMAHEIERSNERLGIE